CNVRFNADDLVAIRRNPYAPLHLSAEGALLRFVSTKPTRPIRVLDEMQLPCWFSFYTAQTFTGHGEIVDKVRMQQQRMRNQAGGQHVSRESSAVFAAVTVLLDFQLPGFGLA